MIRSSTRLAAVAGTLLILQAFAFQPSFAQTPPVTTVVLTGARVIDGTGRAPLENATLLIRNGRVEAVGAPAGVAIPAGATRIDVSGKTIVPGFINAHGHLSNGDQKLPPQVRILQQLRLFAHTASPPSTRWAVTVMARQKSSRCAMHGSLEQPMVRAHMFPPPW